MAEEEKHTPVAAVDPEPEEEEIPMSLDERMDAVEEVLKELITKVENLTKSFDQKLKDAGVKAKGLFGGKRERTPTKDLKTGEVYPSKAAVGKQFAAEVGEEPTNTMAYYKVIGALKMDDGSDRFVPASPEEAEGALAKLKEQQAADQAARQAELDKEQAAAGPAPTQGGDKGKGSSKK